jgi:hypothetical protein
MGAEHLPMVLEFFIKHSLTDLEKLVIDHTTKVSINTCF